MTEQFMAKIIEQLIDHEGVVLKPYRCPSGKLTIGIGRNIEDNGIIEEEAEFMCRNDINRCIDELRDIFAYFDTFEEHQKLALIDFIYNVGMTTFLRFRKTIAAVNNKDWDTASKELKNSRWYNQVGRRGKFIVNQIKGGDKG